MYIRLSFLVLSIGDIYEGMWKENKIHGYGVYERKDGSKYTGSYTETINSH